MYATHFQSLGSRYAGLRITGDGPSQADQFQPFTLNPRGMLNTGFAR